MQFSFQFNANLLKQDFFFPPTDRGRQFSLCLLETILVVQMIYVFGYLPL